MPCSFVGFVILNVEVSELVCGFVVGNHSQIFLQVLLLEVLLGEVLKVSLAEGDACLHNDVLAIFAHAHCISQVTGLVVNLYSLSEEALEVSEDDDVVLNGKSAVNQVLQVNFLLLLLSLLLCEKLSHPYLFNIK